MRIVNDDMNGCNDADGMCHKLTCTVIYVSTYLHLMVRFIGYFKVSIIYTLT